jgi:hypothetical protein
MSSADFAMGMFYFIFCLFAGEKEP